MTTRSCRVRAAIWSPEGCHRSRQKLSPSMPRLSSLGDDWQRCSASETSDQICMVRGKATATSTPLAAKSHTGAPASRRTNMGRRAVGGRSSAPRAHPDERAPRLLPSPLLPKNLFLVARASQNQNHTTTQVRPHPPATTPPPLDASLF
eukprot:scaffold58454_cov31-Tisochrysis_lutea.AAC.1